MPKKESYAKYSSLIWGHEIRVKTHKKVTYKQHYHMACSVSRQDKPNPALWLAGWAGKMELSCPLRPVLAVFCKKNFPESHIISTLIPKLIRPRWLDIGLVFFFASLLASADSDSIHTYNVQSSGLGLEIDRELTFQSHVERLCIKKPSQRIGILKKIGHFLE